MHVVAESLKQVCYTSALHRRIYLTVRQGLACGDETKESEAKLNCKFVKLGSNVVECDLTRACLCPISL